MQSWLRDHPTCPFPTPSEKDAMAAALNMAVKRLNHLVYNTRKRMFPGLCKKKAPTRRRMFPGLRTKKDLTRNTSSVQMPEMILEAAAEAERLAAEAEAERAEQERIRAEQYAADQEARRALMDECKEDLCQQEDREEADKWKRDSERQSQLEKEAEIAVWQAFHPSHLPAVGHEADLNSHIAEIEVPVHADDPLAEAVAQMPEIFPVADDPFPDPWEEYFSVYDDIDTITCATLFPTTPTAKKGSAVLY